jgi:hypothetical protein
MFNPNIKLFGGNLCIAKKNMMVLDHACFQKFIASKRTTLLMLVVTTPQTLAIATCMMQRAIRGNTRYG